MNSPGVFYVVRPMILPGVVDVENFSVLVAPGTFRLE